MEQTVPKETNASSLIKDVNCHQDNQTALKQSQRTFILKQPELPKSQRLSALNNKNTKQRKYTLVPKKDTRQRGRTYEQFSGKLRTRSVPLTGVNTEYSKKQVQKMNNLPPAESTSTSSEEENETEADSLSIDTTEGCSVDSAYVPSERSQWVKTKVGMRLSIPLEDVELQKKSDTCNDVLEPRLDNEASEDEPPISIIEIKPAIIRQRKKKRQPSERPHERVKLLSYLFKEETLHLDRLCQIKPILADLKGSSTGQTSAQPNKARKAFDLCVDMISLQKTFIMNLRECIQQATDPKARISRSFQCLVKKQKYLLSYFQQLPSVLEEATAVLHKHPVIVLPRNEKRPTDDVYEVRHKLQEPTTWLTQTLENVQRLISATPSGNPDAEEFQALKRELISLNADQDPYSWVYGERLPSEQPRRIKMHSLVVVMTHPQSGDRKIRYLLLFSDILVCAKAKITKNSPRIKSLDILSKSSLSTDGPASGNLTNEQLLAEEQECTSLEAKWMIPLDQLVILPNSRIEPDHERMFHKQDKIDRLKKDISQLRMEKKSYEARKGTIVRSKRIEANLMKAEGELILETPQLILPISDGEGHVYHILLVTERERDHWRRALEREAANCTKSNQSVANTQTRSGEHNSDAENKGGGVNQSLKINQYPTISEMNTLLKKYHQLVRLNTTGLALLQRFKGITGTLRTMVYGIDGLNKIDSYHVQIEVDSFNRYEEVARTRVVSQEPNPTWNQEFDIPVDDAHMVCFTIYSHCDYLAEYEVPLKSDCLSKGKTQVTLTTDESPPRTISLEFSLHHLQGPYDYKRHHSTVHRNVFGSPAHTLIDHDKTSTKSGRKENSSLSVPWIVVACVDEIERRGLREVGLYRMCGSNTELQALRDRFNESQEQAIQLLCAVEIPVLTSLLKLFFRELPEPLLTNHGSQELMKAATISNEDERNLSFSKILSALPPVNLETFRYLCQHLVTVSRYREQNMMDLGNLSMIWSNALFQSSTQTLKLVEPAKGTQSFMDSLNKEAAIGFHQTRVLHMILTAVKDQKIPVLSRSSKSLPASKGRQ
ncbi:unnamed protein product [Calicophoron daubneyi]|uniref:Active breakpoint cluster region-related protein n=1 Tax=Calicophoron daubneyi TaxID=300641 RepID=A0AAV2TQC0_CALDB